MNGSSAVPDKGFTFVEQARARELKVRESGRCDIHQAYPCLLQSSATAQGEGYLQSHPELLAFLNDLVTSTLLKKPQDPIRFAAEHSKVVSLGLGKTHK